MLPTTNARVADPGDECTETEHEEYQRLVRAWADAQQSSVESVAAKPVYRVVALRTCAAWDNALQGAVGFGLSSFVVE